MVCAATPSFIASFIQAVLFAGNGGVGVLVQLDPLSVRLVTPSVRSIIFLAVVQSKVALAVI